MRRNQIALQLYTVRRPATEDLAGTLRAVSDAGYRFVEIAGLPEPLLGNLGPLLRASDLRPVASQEPMEHLRSDLRAVARRLTEMGCGRLIVPSIPDDDRQTAADVRRFAAELGRLARTLADQGIRLGYHNHAFEFEPLDGTTAWDVLLAELLPEVEIELDVYWASVGGRDPVAEIRATAGRVRLLHMKDRAHGAEPRDAPAGEGILPFPEIVESARAAGVEWYVVEQDEPADPLADATRALRYLQSLAD